MKKEGNRHVENGDSGSAGSGTPRSARVFRRCDWLVFGLVFAITITVYAFTVAPTVTLEDSGELVVAAEYLGVPHPPGYPLWTILAWMFQLIFSFVRYNGYPNPAWGVNFLSSFFGALTSATVAMLVSRAGLDLLRLQRFGGEVSERFEKTDGALSKWITCSSGIAAGLLLSFSPLQWSQSVIAEVYTLNTFIAISFLLLSYIWLQRPEGSRIPYCIALLFGMAITNFQPIVLIVPAMIIIFYSADRDLFRDVLAPGLVLMAAWVYIFRVRPLADDPGAGAARHVWSIMAALMLLSPAGIWLATRKLMTEWKRVLGMSLCTCLGLCLYFYLPIASDQNPPMNWGYARTWAGFKHVVTRGQYQALEPAVSPLAFLRQAAMHLNELELEFTLPPLLMTLVFIFFFKRIRRVPRMWFGAVFAGFVVFGAGMMAILNPGHDIQSMFVARVQFVPALAMLALLVGGGCVLALGALEAACRNKLLLAPACALVLLYPSILLWRNAYDEDLIRSYGGANLNGFDLGWQFGYYQLYGAEGITRSLKPGEPPLPNPDYPPAMGQGAIFFGGTDPGRFVPTYMIFSARVRPDVFLITQNALADNTYMSVMRDLYGDMIWIPTPKDSNSAFQRYVDDIRAGRIPASANVVVDEESGRVSVQGVQGVMEINGILCRMIFDANKHKHDFYIEESYVINWMYPYLEPHGLIMKINKEPLQGLTEEMIRNDMEFWNWYTERLLGNVQFRRSAVARKSFSKLRCAIAGLYAFHGLLEEAEAAYLQAVELSPISPEANFRLADLYLQHGRFQDAYALLEKNLKLDPRNERLKGFMNQVRELEKISNRMQHLQNELAQGTGTLEMVFELASIYRQTGRMPQFYDISRQLLSNEDVPPDALLRLAEMHATAVPQRPDHLVEVLETYLQRESKNPRVWFELACVRVVMGRNEAALDALRQAVALGGEPIRELANRDNRLDPIRNLEEYQKIIAPARLRKTPFPDAFIR